MNFVITLYRAGLQPQHFNADTLPEARQKMLKAQATRGCTKVELAVIIDTWLPGLDHSNGNGKGLRSVSV